MSDYSAEDKAAADKIIADIFCLNPGMMLEVLVSVMVMDGIAYGRRRKPITDEYNDTSEPLI
jgi:hypothetical protein